MQKKIVVLLSCIFLLSTGIFSQEFAGDDRKQFVKNYTKFMRGSNFHEVKPFIQDELEPLLLESNEMSDQEFEEIKKMLDKMLEKRMQPFPDTYNYLTSVYSFITKKTDDAIVKEWYAIVNEQMESRNPRRIKDFLQFSSNFLYQNIISEDRNFFWFAHTDDFQFINGKAPSLKLGETTLVCKTINRGVRKKENPFSDSVKIENTTGELDLTRNKWTGKEGLFTWEKVGLPRSETFAQLRSYSISFSSTDFKADSVTLTTPYIGGTIEGRLRDRAFKGALKDDKAVPYPQFTSYQADFEINNIVEGIHYRGGFALEAEKFIGVGNKEQQAQLIYYRNDKPFVVTHSDQVRLDQSKIYTPMASMTIYLTKNDSITHTGLDINYNREKKELRLNRNYSDQTKAPFVDTYHQLDLYVDEISWNSSSNELRLAFDRYATDQNRKARFESFGFYDERLFQQLQGTGQASANPLNALYNFAYKYDRFTMSEGDAATAMGNTLTNVKAELVYLSTLGFINYDLERGIVHVTDKTEHFVNARKGKADFDNIAFVSDLVPQRTDENVSGEVATKLRKRNQERAAIKEYGTINLETLDLDVNAVDMVTISELKQTAIFPHNYQVTVKRNRNIIFSGWVNSGKWEIKIDDGEYNYAENKFEIRASDLAYFNVNPFTPEDGKHQIPLQSSLTGLEGELLVDDVTNRSGLKKDFENYPILISKENTKVFYDYKDLYKGAYDKERFYFTVDPFEKDSLANFDEKSIRFTGELTSAGIFPTFKDELKVMPDYSLGFSQKAPAGGYDFYSDEAKYENQILLSNSGLQGAGTIDFLNSQSVSKQLFTFLPDSTVGVATFVNKPQETGIEFPDANGEDAYITYIPHQNKLRAASHNEPIVMFEKEAELYGQVTLTKAGMKGKGNLILPDAAMASANFNFNRWEADADTAQFELENKYPEEGEGESPLAIQTNNVNGHLDFKERKGVFNSNEGESTVIFPVNQYMTKIDQFTWFMDNEEVALETEKPDGIKTDEGVDLVGSNFISIHPKQDSLQFMASKAIYDMKKKTIFTSETEYINVADANIYPEDEKVVIRKDAVLDTLKNAEIIANYITKLHKITDANVSIHGKNEYYANGNYAYSYKTEANDSIVELIYLNNISPNEAYETVAKGIITEDENFKLSEQFNYYGGITFNGSQPTLTFKGATQIQHDCESFERNWMSFEAPIDPNHIMIPVGEQMEDLEENRITAGILWRNSDYSDSVNLYPTFLSQVDTPDDPILISAQGYLHYDQKAKEFQIGDKEKLENRSLSGNFIALHTESCSLQGEGEIDLGMDFGSSVEVKSVGTVQYNQENEETTMNLTLAFRAPIDEKIFQRVGKKIQEVEGLKGIDFNSSTLEQAIGTWVDQETADKIKTNYTLEDKTISIPKELRDAIVISGLHLTSHTIQGDAQRGIKSAFENAELISMFGTPVMKTIPFKLFTEKRVGIGDRLAFLIDVPGAYLYFFDYDYRGRGELNILSSDQKLNEEIEGLKSDKKKARRFSYDITKRSAYQSQFLRVFE